MKASQLLNTLEILSPEEQASILDSLRTCQIKGIAYDSRLVQAGSIFVAIRGTQTDGHRYLAQAKKKGACMAIVEAIETSLSLPQVQVKNCRRALSSLSAAWFDYPAREMIMTGITGSNGKTTTAMMLDTILSENSIGAGMLGTIFYRIGQQIETADLTTPESLELHGILRKQVEFGFERSVMEVSSISIDQCRVADITYDVMAFNNITREHIDQHGSFENYLQAKMSLMQRLPASSIAIIGGDDKIIMENCANLNANTISFGLDNKSADVLANKLDLSSGFARFELSIERPIPTLRGILNPIRLPVSLNVPGLNSVYNALSAMTMAMVQGLRPQQASAGIAAYKGVERRFQRVFDRDYQIYDDHFGNAGNVRMTLQTVDHMTKNQLHLAFAVRGNRGVTVNREIAEEMANWRDRLPWGKIIVTLSRDVTKAKDEVKTQEAEVFIETLKAAGYAFDLVDTLEQAMHGIVDSSTPGDVVILGGAQGMDPGARVALNYILEENPSFDAASIMAPLEGRICG